MQEREPFRCCGLYDSDWNRNNGTLSEQVEGGLCENGMGEGIP